MNSITTTAKSIATESSVAPPVERRWMSIVFLQGEEADTALDMIDRNGPEAAIHHLSQWDYGDQTRDAALVNGYVYDEIPQSPTDRVIRGDGSGYALTYNRHFGYVALLRHFDPVLEGALESMAPPARFGFERQRTARRSYGLRL
ncbi:hypothetical protein [Microbacterium hibisci]|uniref:hypothetical protein n=1 Tax=Microbacterium hibisci TaxID=2036000 RepID=UPI001941B391|nr:hypothetical protein [Microbacterium hibisci]